MNPNTIPWLHYQDIQIFDEEIRKQFDYYMDNGQFVEAIKILNNNQEQLKGKAFIADTINKIIYGILQLENRFNNDVTIYLSDLAIRFFNLVDNFCKKGDWNSSVAYIPYNFVLYKDEVYMNIKTTPLGTLPTNDVYWLKIGLRGKEGSPGVDLTLRYDWNSTKTYEYRDLVVYNGNIYLARKTNTNIKPDTDMTNWLIFIMVDKGEINVGVDEPSKKSINTIWFKTEKDPTVTAQKTEGAFYRYVASDDDVEYKRLHTNYPATTIFDDEKTTVSNYLSKSNWEIMYPVVVSTMIDGLEGFAPKLENVDIEIKPKDWIPRGKEYIYQYLNRAISIDSDIEIIPKNNIEFYSTLRISEISSQLIELSTLIKPTSNLKITIKIQ